MNLLIALIVALLIAAVFAAIVKLIPLPGEIGWLKNVLYIIIALVFLLWLLNYFNVLSAHFPR